MDSREKLIVAADYNPKDFGGKKGVEKEVLNLANILSGLGVYIKINSILRAIGYQLIDMLHDKGLRVFADLKLIDIPNTMEIDACFLKEYKPDLLTVMCSAGVEGMRRVQEVLPETKVLGVTVLTSLDEEDCQAVFTCSTKAGVLRFARMAKLAKLGDLILSPKEVDVVKNRRELMLGLNTPGIRPEWAFVDGDDQSRFLTPFQAIRNGSDRIVVGRPITQSSDPRDAVLRTIEEIEKGLE